MDWPQAVRVHRLIGATRCWVTAGCASASLACALALLVDYEGGLIALEATPIEIELVDDARCNALVLLAEEKKQAIRAGGEEVDSVIRIVRLQLPKMVGNLLRKRSGMLASSDVLMASARRHRE